MRLNHACRVVRLCTLLILGTLLLGGCEMTRKNTRFYQAHQAAKAKQKAEQAAVRSGNVPAYWTRRAATGYEFKHAIGEITVNGRPVLVTRFTDKHLWTGGNGHTLLDKYVSLRANEGVLRSDLELGRDGISAEEDAERFRRRDFSPREGEPTEFRWRARSSRQCYDTQEIPTALSVAFIDVEGVIVNIEELPPNYIVPQCSQRSVNRTLVMRSGWFAANGIQPGDHVGEFKSILVRELPEIIARYDHDPIPTPVAWADWNGWPLAHLTLSGPQGATGRDWASNIIRHGG